jgi:hypothetical protein
MLSAIKGTKHQIAKKRIAKHLIQKFKTSGVTINWLPSFILLLIIKIIFIQEYRNSFYFSSSKGYLGDNIVSLIDINSSLIDIVKVWSIKKYRIGLPIDSISLNVDWIPGYSGYISV